jgi:acetyl esterase
VLYYPITDLSHFDTLSYRENGEAYFLTRDSMLWFARHYLRDEADARNPLASPLLCPDLSRLPPALVITAEYDPLRDEGEAYAKQLERAGSRARLSRYDGMIHGFVTMSSYLQGGARATEEAARMLRSAFDQA